MGKKSLVKKSKFSTRKIVFISVIMGLFMSLAPLAQLAKDNLAKYSVYYAGNMPHKAGTDPELVAIIDNLDKIYIPNLDENSRVVDELDAKNYISSKNRNYQYDFLTYSIDFQNKNMEYILYRRPNSSKTERTYILTKWEGSSSIAETIGVDGTLISIYDTKNEYYPKTIDLLKFEEEKNKILGNIIKAKQKPSINLQFIYNYLNQSKFN
ncbi:MAG: hypothetical protein LBI13_07490 [Streptococcaceae bacterium]|nr:hypothetical protein [Streptococcaceae bacterium]